MNPSGTAFRMGNKALFNDKKHANKMIKDRKYYPLFYDILLKKSRIVVIAA